MRVTFLGTGTSQGVPVIACDCMVCTSADPYDKRLRVSVLLETPDRTIVIDSGPDFRYQMLRVGVKHLDAILFTHEHKDHIAGMDDIRAFNYRQKTAIDVYGHQRVLNALRQEFSYIFSGHKYPGLPLVNLHEIDLRPFSIGSTGFTPIEVMHFHLPVLGFRTGDFTYITDAKSITEAEADKIRGSKIVVINALQKDHHLSHLTLDEAIHFAQDIQAGTTYFTHISHKMGRHADISKELPPGIQLAYDGLSLEVN